MLIDLINGTLNSNSCIFSCVARKQKKSNSLPNQVVGFTLEVAFDSLSPNDCLRKGTNRLF